MKYRLSPTRAEIVANKSETYFTLETFAVDFYYLENHF